MWYVGEGGGDARDDRRVKLLLLSVGGLASIRLFPRSTVAELLADCLLLFPGNGGGLDGVTKLEGVNGAVEGPVLPAAV